MKTIQKQSLYDQMCEVKEREDNLAFLKDVDKPSLENLSYALRHPETWPDGLHLELQ